MNAPLLAAGAATLVCLGVYAGHAAGLTPIPALESWELGTLDARFELRGARAPKGDGIVLVGLDEKARKETKVFQSRRAWAELIDALAEYRPRAIGIDAFFSSPEVKLSETTVEAVREARSELSAEEARTEAGDRALDALAAVDRETRGDELLAEAIERAGNVYLGVHFHPGEGGAPAGSPEPVGLAGARYGESVATEQPRSRRPRASGWATRSLEPIAQAAAGAGFVNVDPDQDGDVRRVPLVLEHGGRYYMPLAMSLALEALGAGAGSAYVTGQPRVRVGGRDHPTRPDGQAHLSFLGPGQETFPQVSAADVLSGRAPAGALEDKIALVGYMDVARDTVATPLDSNLHGVEIHATLLHNLLHGEFLRAASRWHTLLILLAGGGLLTLLQLRRIRHRRAWIAGVGALVLIALYLGASQALFAAEGLIVEVVAPVLSFGVVALASMTAALATEGRERALLRHVFSQYVQGSVVDRILDDPSRARLGGVRRELTVLFADIRGFSALSEALAPEELSQRLNQYFTPMTDLVMDEGGMLDKYIGDAIMAVFGAPLEEEDHAAQSCRAALAMLESVKELNERWKDGAQGRGIAVGIGLNSGDMAVGNMGSERRFNYTVLGDAVNLGARLEALTKDYRADILVGERTAELAGDEFVFRELDVVRVKGREGVARVFELVGTREMTRLSDDDLILFDEALSAYRNRDWGRAEEAFSGFLERHPEDGPAEVLRGRVRALRQDPPGPDWDGVFVQASK